MCKLFDKIFQLPFKRWTAKEHSRTKELVVPIDDENMKLLRDVLAKYFEENKNE